MAYFTCSPATRLDSTAIVARDCGERHSTAEDAERHLMFLDAMDRKRVNTRRAKLGAAPLGPGEFNTGREVVLQTE